MSFEHQNLLLLILLLLEERFWPYMPPSPSSPPPSPSSSFFFLDSMNRNAFRRLDGLDELDGLDIDIDISLFLLLLLSSPPSLPPSFSSSFFQINSLTLIRKLGFDLASLVLHFLCLATARVAVRLARAVKCNLLLAVQISYLEWHQIEPRGFQNHFHFLGECQIAFLLIWFLHLDEGHPKSIWNHIWK